MSKFILSVDLGQTIDPTAVAVLEVTTRRDAVDAYYSTPEPLPDAIVPPLDWFYTGVGASGNLKHPNHSVRIDVRHLERLPLRTNYVDVVDHVRKLLSRPPLSFPRAELVLDQTGVGRPVVDMFRRKGLRPIGVTITGGANNETTRGDDCVVSKLLLVSRMQAMLHSGELRIAKELPDARTLGLEMQDFRANISETGIARFGAREGSHDDLVLAVAIGAWRASWSNYATLKTFVA